MVDGMAQILLAHVAQTAPEIATLHVHGAKSQSLQDHFAKLLKVELGFETEVVLTPQDGLVTRARPDFFFRLSDSRRILAEVERGGTTTNNHDLKRPMEGACCPRRPAPVSDRSTTIGGRTALHARNHFRWLHEGWVPSSEDPGVRSMCSA